MIERTYKSSGRKKQYRAVVIDAHTIFKFFVFMIAVAALSVSIALGMVPASSSRSGPSQSTTDRSTDKSQDKTEDKSGDKTHDESKDETKDETEDKDSIGGANDAAEAVLGSACGFVLGFDPRDAKTVVAAEVPGAELVNSYQIIEQAAADGGSSEPSPTPEPEPEPQTADNGELEIKAINAGQNANSDTNYVKIGNQTSYGVDVAELLAEPLTLDMNAEGPKVLIVHTHATEAYAPEGARRYNSGESDRSLDTSENVVAVGDEVTRIFNERGIETLHDTALHDHPSFNGAYADALTSIEDYLSKYPSIQIVFDLHRDSIVYGDGTKAKVLTKIDGRDAAQLMFVVGTNEKGLYNPDWRENLKLAVQLQDAIDQKYPNLMRHVNLRQERFNCHATHGSMIIEMGSSGNSLSEAKYGMECAAEVIADFLNGLSV